MPASSILRHSALCSIALVGLLSMQNQARAQVSETFEEGGRTFLFERTQSGQSRIRTTSAAQLDDIFAVFQKDADGIARAAKDINLPRSYRSAIRDGMALARTMARDMGDNLYFKSPPTIPAVGAPTGEGMRIFSFTDGDRIVTLTSASVEAESVGPMLDVQIQRNGAGFGKVERRIRVGLSKKNPGLVAEEIEAGAPYQGSLAHPFIDARMRREGPKTSQTAQFDALPGAGAWLGRSTGSVARSNKRSRAQFKGYVYRKLDGDSKPKEVKLSKKDARRMFDFAVVREVDGVRVGALRFNNVNIDIDGKGRVRLRGEGVNRAGLRKSGITFVNKSKNRRAHMRKIGKAR